MSAAPRTATATGRATRARIGLQVLAVVLVAGAVAALATWLAARPGLHKRFDLTASAKNTLDPALVDILKALPEEAQVELFFRDLDEPLTGLSREVQGRVRDFLFLASQAVPGKLAVVDHDTGDIERVKARMAELDLREDNVLVVSLGTRRSLLRLYRDVAVLDPGRPDRRAYVPPTITALRPDEALAIALKRVSAGAAQKILFSTGHGERDVYTQGERGLGQLRRALLGDGFEVGWWEAARTPDVPADCDVLAVIDPDQPFTAEEIAAVRRFVEAGGRLFATPSQRIALGSAAGTVSDLLEPFGIVMLAGVVAAPYVAPGGGELTGDLKCALLAIGSEGLDPRSPVTESLWRGKRTLRLPFSRGFRRGTPPPDGVLLELVKAPDDAWVDLPNAATGIPSWRYEQGEEHGAVPLCMASVFRGTGAAGPDGESPAARVIALGSAEALSDALFATNADFVLNAFNWLAARDWRVSIAPRTSEPTRLDLRSGTRMDTVRRSVMYGLPGLCAVLGALLYWRRRSR